MALIKDRLDVDAATTLGETGQFDVLADGVRVARRGGSSLTRRFGAGYPDLEGVVEALEKHRAAR